MASAYPTFTNPRKPYVQHAWKEEKFPELKEIDEDEDGVAWVSFRLDKDFEWETHFNAELSLPCNMHVPLYLYQLRINLCESLFS